MAHIVIAAHGNLAQALADSARLICGDKPVNDVECLNMTEGKSVQQFCDEARAVLERHPDDDFLILTDMFGASPFNNCLLVFQNASYRLVTGVNLPLLIEVLTQNYGQGLEELWQGAIHSGKESIQGVYLPIHSPLK
jgi:mannose PTS system EIIA component